MGIWSVLKIVSFGLWGVGSVIAGLGLPWVSEFVPGVAVDIVFR